MIRRGELWEGISHHTAVFSSLGKKTLNSVGAVQLTKTTAIANSSFVECLSVAVCFGFCCGVMKICSHSAETELQCIVVSKKQGI